MNREQYDQIEALNYSTLSKLEKDPRLLIAEPEKPGRGMLIGSLIDCLTLDKDNFNSKFFVSSAKLPTDKMFELLTEYTRLCHNNDKTVFPINNDIILQANKTIGFGAANWKEDTIISKFTESCSTYLEEIQQAGDRIVVDKSLVNIAEELSNRLLTHDFTADIFKSEYISLHDRVVWSFEVWDIAELFKAEFDFVTADKDNNVVIYDIKFTSGDPYKFYDTVILFNYHYQAALYLNAATSVKNSRLRTLENERLKEILLNAKSIRFEFLILSENHPPLKFAMPDSLIDYALYGGAIPTLTGKIIKLGIVELVKAYRLHKMSDYYECPWSVYSVKGYIPSSLD